MQAFYSRGSGETNFNSELPLYVNNCGYYKNLDSDISVNRPRGRDDYHMLMTSSGKIYVGPHELTAGKVYLFFPRSQQHYRYEGGKGSEYYWLHFSGSRIPALFESYRLKEGVINIGSSCGDIERLIKMMMRAFSEKYKYADDFCEGILASLLSYIAAPPIISSPYGKAIKILGDLSDGSSVEEIASIYNMSPNHFIRSFKQYVGLSPNAFRIEKRMEMACEMLISTDMTVERVASAVGYADPLYFSRAFRKRTGHSPSEFRKVKRSLFQDPNSSL